MTALAGIAVVAFGLVLIGFAGVVFVRPAPARRFLLSFASSARAHYLEQVIRLLIGASLVVRSPLMLQSQVFLLLGWVIVVTSMGLMLVPWRWHHRLGERVLPVLVRHIELYAVSLLAFGAVLLYSVFR